MTGFGEPGVRDDPRHLEGVDVPGKRRPEVTTREADILRGILAHKTYPQIANGLGLSLETIKSYAARLRAKLGVDTKVGLALWAERNLKDQPACGPS